MLFYLGEYKFTGNFLSDILIHIFSLIFAVGYIISVGILIVIRDVTSNTIGEPN